MIYHNTIHRQAVRRRSSISHVSCSPYALRALDVRPLVREDKSTYSHKSEKARLIGVPIHEEIIHQSNAKNLQCEHSYNLRPI